MDVSLQNKYKKLDQRQHVLSRPGMYIGSNEEDIYNTWVFNEVNNTFIKREVKIVPGLYKIVDEILVNAIDHAVRTRQGTGDTNCIVKNIKITIDKSSGFITVWNDGNGIEVEKHPEHGIYIPELIFGHLLTGTNYDDEEEKTIGGQNGIGAKACNIFSKVFAIETIDHIRKKMYTQEFRDNMIVRSTPTIKTCTKKPYTQISFLPDYEKFKMTGMTEDMYTLLVRRCYDVCALTDNDINVWINGKKLDIKNFEKYVDMYLGPKNETFRTYEKIGERWEVVASCTTVPGFEQVSFVNGIWTVHGGKHVDYVANQITNQLGELINKKKKDAAAKPQHIKNYLMLFVKSTIANPTFSSQSKEALTTPMSKFGSKGELSEKFIEKLYKSDLVAKVLSLCESNATKAVKKTDGKKRSTLYEIEKLDDANWAGTPRSKECTLILTEGDSAKSMAICGLNIVGRDRYGVFPLKGKLLNVKDISLKKLSENDEITNIKKIMGLEAGKTYNSLDELRYGRIMIMTDQDVDGSHIKGLLFNLFHELWPSLFKTDGFITSLLTPVIKAKRASHVLNFYSVVEFEQWKEKQPGGNIRDWVIKYYKGLGTSTDEEAKEYFRNLKMVNYKYNDQDSESSIQLAFNKKLADDRKMWLGKYNRNNILDYNIKDVRYEEFVHKDLIHFSNYDIERSIPSVVDGLKVSQRKIMFGCFKKNLTKEIRVQQLSGYISENTLYHHGDVSLQAAIVGMAQNFVGSNNVNLLKPIGQFGTRTQGGKNAASARYIHTHLGEITSYIYKPDDTPVLKYLDDDGTPVEPEYYVPVIPMVLVNGAVGIGTGFSTNIPCFNPREIIDGLIGLLARPDGVSGAEPIKLMPWYRGFKGTIIEDENGKYSSKGCWERVNDTTIRVTELPIGFWTDDFKRLLEQLVETCADIKAIENHYDNANVDFTITFTSKAILDAYIAVDDKGCNRLETVLKLSSPKSLSVTNMYLFNSSGQIQRYDNIHDIIVDHYNTRIAYYDKRRQHLINELENDKLIMASRCRFITEVVNEELIVYKRSKDAITDDLHNRGYSLHPQQGSYDYLLQMPIYNFTAEKIDKINNDLVSLNEKLEQVKGTYARAIWLEELESLKAEVITHLEDYPKSDDDMATISSKPSTKRQPVRRVKK